MTVNAVNDPPIAAAKSFTAQTNMKITGLGLLSGATDPDTGDAGYTASFTLSGVTIGAGCVGGTISNVNLAAGTFDFDPAAGSTATCTLTYRVDDSGNPGPGATSAPATITITVIGPVIWFVNPAAAPNGSGRLSSPFNALSSVDAVDAANHRVFIYTGTTTTGLVLNSGEWLIGQATTNAPTNTFDALMAISPPAGTIARPTIGTGTVTVGGTVTLNANAVVKGLAVSTNGVPAVDDPIATIAGVTVDQASVTATNAAAALLSDTSGTIALSSLSSSNAPGSALSLADVGGSFSAAGGLITNAVGFGVHISFGNGSFDYDGQISDDDGPLVKIESTTGGTKSFDGAITDLNNGTGNGISLTNNSGATVNFAGGLTLSTGANPAFTATGGGVVNVTGVGNTLATTTGTALVFSDTIGTSGLTFRSISSNGAVSGIKLDFASGSGALAVTGLNGVAGSGGTVQNSTGRGISLVDASAPVNLSYMNVQNGLAEGLWSTSLPSLALTGLSVSNNGDVAGEHGLLIGARNVTIADSAVSGSAGDNANIISTSPSSTSTLTITNSSFSSNSALTGGDGLEVDLLPGSATVSISGSTFANNHADQVLFRTVNALSGLVSHDVTFNGNTVTGNGVQGNGIKLEVGDASTIAVSLTGNNIQNAASRSIWISPFIGAFTFSGTIANNTIGTAGVLNSGGQGGGITVWGGSNAASVTTVAVTGNTIRQAGGASFPGIEVRGNQAGLLNATVTSNTVTNPTPLSSNGISIASGTQPGDTATLCANVSANSITGSTGGPFATDFRLYQGGTTTFRMPGYAGTAYDTAAAVAFVKANNGGTPTGAAVSSGAGAGFVGGASCPTP